MNRLPDLNNRHDAEEWAELNAPDWMLTALAMNPNYCGWAPGDDYMRGAGSGRDAAMEFDSWTPEMLAIDDLNVCADFYFRVSRRTGTEARLSLVVWRLHPRKGASRGVTIRDIKESDLPSIRAWLTKAAQANAARFAKALTAA